MDSIYSIIRSIPNEFYALATGGAISLISVAITNRSHATRLDRQLAHEHDMRRQQYAMDLKKTVLIEGVLATFAGISSIQRFANLAIDQAEIVAPYQDQFPALGKVYAVASADTVRHFTEVNSMLGAIFFALVHDRVRLSKLDQEADTLSDQISRDNTALEAHFSRLDSRQDFISEAEWASSKRHAESVFKRLEEQKARLSALHREINEEHRKLFKEVAEANSKVEARCVDLLVAVRKEIGLEDGEPTVRAALVRMSESGKKVINDFITSVEI